MALGIESLLLEQYLTVGINNNARASPGSIGWVNNKDSGQWIRFPIGPNLGVGMTIGEDFEQRFWRMAAFEPTL